MHFTLSTDIPMFNVVNESSDTGITADQPGSDAVADINPEDIESINMLTGPQPQHFMVSSRFRCSAYQYQKRNEG